MTIGCGEGTRVGVLGALGITRFWLLFFAAAVSWCGTIEPLAVVAAEQSDVASTRTVITTINAKQLATVLQKAGFAAEFDEEDDNGNVVDLTIDGYHAVCFVWADGARLEFFAGFSDQTLTANVINDWAGSNRVSRVYVSEDGTAAVKSDLYLKSGVTRDMLVFYCQAFNDDFRTFVDVMIPIDGSEDDPFSIAPTEREDALEAPVPPAADDPFSADPFGDPGSGASGLDEIDDAPAPPSPPEGDGLFDNPFGDALSASSGLPIWDGWCWWSQCMDAVAISAIAIGIDLTV